jgi:eukaryotic-like serine/threonine-protein kinase
MPLSVGDKLGPYEIVAPLGAGGMGEVWKARDTRLDRIVAVKRLKGRHSARFEQEGESRVFGPYEISSPGLQQNHLY